MKNINLTIFICLIVIILLNVESKENTKNTYMITPKAIALKNHFGHPSVGSPYGATLHDVYTQIVEGNPDTYMPFKTNGRENILKAAEYRPTAFSSSVLNPHFIRGGEFTNVAPSASKIIRPQIIGPKLKVSANVEYPSTVEVAVFKGMKKEYHDVSALDKKNNRIVHTKALINRPNYVRERKIMTVSHPHEYEFDLNTGKHIVREQPKKELHGLKEVDPCIQNNNCKTHNNTEPIPHPQPQPQPNNNNTEPIPHPQPQPNNNNTEPIPHPQPQPNNNKTEPIPHPQPHPTPNNNNKTEPIPHPEPQNKPQPKPEVKPITEPEPKVKPVAKKELKPVPKTEVKPETKPVLKQEVKPEVKPVPKTEVKPEVKPEVKHDNNMKKNLRKSKENPEIAKILNRK